MHIVYAVTTCSDRVYRQLFSEVKVKPAFQAQKYHRLLIEGLAAGGPVDVVANPPVNKRVLSKAFISLPKEEEGGAVYYNLPAIRNPLLKLLWVCFGTFFKTLFLVKRDSAVVVDCLNRVAALSGIFAARLRGVRCVGIVTDLPDMLSGSRFSKGLANFAIRCCTDYVFLTERMNEYLNPGAKPYVVLEGHADISMADRQPVSPDPGEPRICLYAGGVSRQYGLDMLVEGFRSADIPNTRLDIYGPGDYVEDLKTIAKEDPRVRYGGMLLSSQVVEKELEATLLVNPRPTHEEYVKYSFPSKTMEYMATGTPVLTTVLPGMPEDYYPHVYFIREETPEGISQALRQVFDGGEQAMKEKGLGARRFVLENRNNVVQAQKIRNMLKE